MALAQINIGNAANDGQGDDLREAFIKVNQNFQTLESIAEQSGANVGAASGSVYKETADNVLYFRTLAGGTGISLTTLDNTVVITNTVASANFTITTPQGTVIGGTDINLNFFDGQGVEITGDENTKTITFNAGLSRDPTPALEASLDARSNDITAVNNFSANSILGNRVTTTNLVPTNITGVDTVEYYDALGRYIEGFDMGGIQQVLTSQLDWVMYSSPIDLGTFLNPLDATMDLGNI